MYNTQAGYVLGFHGCDQSVANAVISGQKDLKPSENDYDWLGSGVYFWEQNPDRALEYARLLKRHPERTNGNTIQKPAVLGAVLDLGNCLNLLEQQSLLVVKGAYVTLSETMKLSGRKLPKNENIKGSSDLLLRHLDCAVMESLHTAREQENETSYDSVRGMFPEGDTLYDNAGFRDHSHIQICVRNPNCIKGYFRVRKPTSKYRVP